MKFVKLLHTLLFLLLGVTAFGQTKKTKIEIVFARTIKQINRSGEVVRLIGDVRMKHEGALMYCDSAHFFPVSNSMIAYSNVHINQGDTLHLYGDILDYNGNTKMADIRGNVKLVDPDLTLTTSALMFDRNSQVGYYTTGAEIIAKNETLRSIRGLYDGNTNLLRFKEKVELQTEDYIIYSDTMYHHSESEQTWFYGKTHITGNGGDIYCNKGYFNAISDYSWFVDSVFIYNDAQLIRGDSVFYNQQSDVGQVYDNVFLSDTVEGYSVTGTFARYTKKNSYAFVTGFPVYSIDVDGDSLHLAGDTLLTFREHDTTERFLKVYHNVRIYKSDFQGRCDSLFYSEIDSTFHLYHQPILWTGINQMTSDNIALKLRDGKMDSLFMTGNAFLLSETEEILYDQIKGKNMYGQFVDNELERIFVSGNGQTVYNAYDENEVLLGINRADCSDLEIKVKDNKIMRIIFLVKPDATLYPVEDIPEGEKRLKGFKPRFEERPSLSDIFQ
ncbi:MAG: hypothetical protein EP346_06690 [Bacteroidetes bacterium]|nr:MAG: hypothetical protein EP346_06690 [Bacteroidota bacterium]